MQTGTKRLQQCKEQSPVSDLPALFKVMDQLKNKTPPPPSCLPLTGRPEVWACFLFLPMVVVWLSTGLKKKKNFILFIYFFGVGVALFYYWHS